MFGSIRAQSYFGHFNFYVNLQSKVWPKPKTCYWISKNFGIFCLWYNTFRTIHKIMKKSNHKRI
ncbi:hypothetical protein BpHYR1_028767 [Brachionus plicatilis]|uniref:Uncharacterized protein n=1 Tax=Brachionus plicatilis TaxID=10195 RepID=A0A3M7RSI0_BRAPC|nr:hypothetical protein BpHYR1_028767 [Brachionus plicatilis]